MQPVIAVLGVGCLVWYLRRNVYRTPPMLPALGRWFVELYEIFMRANDRYQNDFWEGRRRW